MPKSPPTVRRSSGARSGHRTVRMLRLIAVLVGASVPIAVQTSASAQSDEITWNIAININWSGDGSSGTEATFLKEDGVSLDNCGGCDFGFEFVIDGAETVIPSGPVPDPNNPNPLALFPMDGIVVGFAQGSYGQTFTATTSGTLSRAALDIACLVTGTAPADVRVGLFELNVDGDALVRQVASVPFRWDDCNTEASWPPGNDAAWSADDFSRVSFPFNAPVTIGTSYAVLFTGTSVGGFQPSTELEGVSPMTAPTPAGPSYVAPAGVLPSQPAGAREWVQADGSSLPLTASAPAPNQVRYAGDGIQVTLTGAQGTSVTNGLVANAAGEVECEVCATLAAGGVIEAWMFSDPRLVAAWRIEDLSCQRFTIPVGAPLDGGGPVSAGVHTLQLALPTAQGMQAVNVGVTVGGPVPASVPAGEGPTVPAGLLVLGLLAAAGALAVRRQVVTG